MLCSLASLSPSVILASASDVAFLSLQVSFALGAIFIRPGGTIIGGRGLSERGSTNWLSWMSLGVPLKAGDGNLIVNGTLSPEPLSAAWTDWTKLTSAIPRQTENPTLMRRH